jgi:SulP family sulfate permease
MIAFLEAKRAGLFTKGHLVNNIVAGLIVGIVALPLAMAFAIASGAKPEQGIYTAIVAGGLTSLFGGSRLQIAGPTGAFIVILSGITAKYGIEGLQVATLMAGVMLLLMGLTRFGGVIKFLIQLSLGSQLVLASLSGWVNGKTFLGYLHKLVQSISIKNFGI